MMDIAWRNPSTAKPWATQLVAVELADGDGVERLVRQGHLDDAGSWRWQDGEQILPPFRVYAIADNLDAPEPAEVGK